MMLAPPAVTTRVKVRSPARSVREALCSSDIPFFPGCHQRADGGSLA